MTTAHLSIPTPAHDDAVDPRAARAEFFFDLEMQELRVTIPQAAPPSGIAKY